MVNQINNDANAKRKAGKKKKDFFDSPPDTTSATRSQSKESTINEDLIVSLSYAYENKRARQVTEWERRQNTQPSIKSINR